MDAIVPLVRNLFKTRFEDLPPHVVTETKKSVLDTLACMLAGTSAAGCPEIAERVIQWGGKEESSIVNSHHKVPVFLAALANGTMARAVDLDDVFEPGTAHVSASIVPTAFAVAEMIGGVGGRPFLNALALGADMICRMSRANEIPPGVSGMNATFQYAYFACAGAAGKILGLDEEELLHAMGLAYSQTSGNSQNLLEGTLATRFCQGLAAQGGVYSAVFARMGTTAANEVLEGKFGYYRVYQRDAYDREKLLDGLGERFEGVNVTRKLYPCCMHSHSAIDGIMHMTRRFHLKSDDLEKVTVGVNQQGYNFVCLPVKKKRAPNTIPEAQFSLPYAAATALVKGRVFLEDFTDPEIANPDVLEMATKIECVVDPQLERAFSGSVTPATVEVVTKRGERFSEEVKGRKGSPTNPLHFDEIAEKFRRCANLAKRRLSHQHIEKTITSIEAMEALEDVTQIMTLLD